MNKTILVRASIVLGVLILAILIPVGIEALSNNESIPELSNTDDVYLTVDGVEITNGELWTKLRNIEGANYIDNYILEQLLATELAAVTPEEIASAINLAKFYTDDEDVIADIMADEEIYQDYLEAFNSTLISNGYDPENDDSVADYVSLGIAQKNYAINEINTSVDGDTYYVSDEDVALYYEDFEYGDVCSIDLRFSNATEVINVFDEYDLILNFEGGIGEYIGLLDIEDVLVFDDSNTVTMSNDTVFSFFVKIYNEINPWQDPISEDITKEDFCANHSDIAVKNYEEMIIGNSSEHPLYLFADYLFNTLEDNQNGTPYTYTNTKQFDDFTILSYKISSEDVTSFSALEPAEQDEIRAEYIEATATDTAITAIMDTLIASANVEIFDPYIALVYNFNNGTAFDNKGSKTLVATTDDFDITVDDYYEYIESKLGVFYSIEIAKEKILLDSEEYTELYGESHDYFNSNNEQMEEHVVDLDDMKAKFGTNQYASYGYASSLMTWEEFMILAFTMESEEELLENMFIIPSILVEVMHDEIDYDDSIAYMEDQIERYYSLNTNHVLLYFDFDFDFEPDNYEDYTAELTTVEQDELTALLVSFRNLIRDKVDVDELTFAEIVEEYQETLLTDETSEWAQFKQAGFYIKTEELGEIDHSTGTSLDETFEASLKRIYDVMVDLDEESYNDDQLTISQFGVHYISATQGAAFEQYTAEYVDTEDYGDPENDSVMPNLAQVELYIEIQHAAAASENTTAMFNDDDVYAAVEFYYGPIYNSYLSSSSYSAYLGQFIIDNGTYGENNADKMAKLQSVTDVLLLVNYPDLFGQAE